MQISGTVELQKGRGAYHALAQHVVLHLQSLVVSEDSVVLVLVCLPQLICQGLVVGALACAVCRPHVNK